MKWAQPERSVRSTIAGQWTRTMHEVEQDQRRDEPGQPAHDRNSHRGDRSHRASQPGRPEQQQRRGDHREHQVLHHVDAVEVALGEVVDRPVGREQHRERRRAPKQVTWKRVATGAPGGSVPRPDADRARSRTRRPSSPTSSQTSGCGCHAGNCAAHRHRRRAQSTDVEAWSARSCTGSTRADRPDDEEPPEDRLVGAQVHVPGRDQEELHERQREQQPDEQRRRGCRPRGRRGRSRPR